MFLCLEFSFTGMNLPSLINSNLELMGGHNIQPHAIELYFRGKEKNTKQYNCGLLSEQSCMLSRLTEVKCCILPIH